MSFNQDTRVPTTTRSSLTFPLALFPWCSHVISTQRNYVVLRGHSRISVGLDCDVKSLQLLSPLAEMPDGGTTGVTVDNMVVARL